MSQPTENTYEHDDLDSDPDRILDALQDVLTEFDEYVAAWFDRLDDTLSACGPLPEPVADMLDCDDAGLREKTEQLTAAWLRLESEQRKFLQLTASYQHGRDRNPSSEASAAAEAAAPAEMPGKEPAEDVPANNPGAPKRIQQATQSPTTRSSAAASARSTRDAACEQFQRLKQQIESNRPKSS